MPLYAMPLSLSLTLISKILFSQNMKNHYILGLQERVWRLFYQMKLSERCRGNEAETIVD